MMKGLPFLLAVLMVAFPTGLRAQGLELHRLWELGGIDGPEEVMWNRVSDARIIGEYIYILGHFPSSARQFSVHGEFLRELGREGRGPSEFVAPSAVREAADSIAIYDFMQRRWIFFDTAGKALDTRAYRDHPNPSLFRPFGTAGPWHLALTAWRTNDSRHFPPALIQWRDPARVDTIVEIPTGLFMSRTDHSGGQWNSSSFGVGSAGGVDEMGDSLIVVVDGLSLSATLYRRTNRGLVAERRWDLPGQVTTLTEDVKDDLIERWVDRWNVDSDPTREFRAPDSIPAWTDVQVGEEGVVWLKKGGSGGFFDGTERWFRWSLEDNSFDELKLTDGVEVLDIKEDLLLALRRGQFDEPYLQLYQIRVR